MADKLYEITLVGDYNGEETVNRWNYVATGSTLPSGVSFALADALGFTPIAGVFPVDTMAGNIAAYVRAEVVYTQVLVRAVYDPTDFADIPFVPGVLGLLDVDKALPNSNAYGFRTNRIRADIARGTKRFAGVEANYVQDINKLTAGGITAGVVVAESMSEVHVTSVGGVAVTLTPTVVKKFLYTTPRGHKAYRYANADDGGEAAQMTQLATGVIWDVYHTIRTQVSRQAGKGK